LIRIVKERATNRSRTLFQVAQVAQFEQLAQIVSEQLDGLRSA
jgi:hypothetical protein